ncbi:tenomodulin isoform X2 [Rhinatrema bivittatum]|nr:tenomodulin isoform X2 [Rhinatrema bivittatum]XP_029463294.1 tenomodulin isoform X2 [Rhinatrema bivittatum]
MEQNPQVVPQQCLLADVEASKTKSKCKRYKIWGLIVCLLLALSLFFLLFGLKHFWSWPPEKIYDAEYKFFTNGEKMTVLMEIYPMSRTETFRMENGTDKVLEIHDFKNGITGIFLAGLQKCFIKNQIKVIPEVADAEMEKLEGDEITTTYYEQSIMWVPEEKPIEDKEFLRNSKVFEICKNVSVHWIHPAFLTAPKFQDIENGVDGSNNIPADRLLWPKEYNDQQIDAKSKPGGKRQARDLTEEDLPVNDYSEVGLELNPMLDHRGFCCSYCRRGQRYCQRVCEPLLGYYPYPYCYGGGRVICRIIMPCNWWIARMLGRV